MIWKDADQKTKVAIDCTYCDNQGQIERNTNQEKQMDQIRIVELIGKVVENNSKTHKNLWSTLQLMYFFQILSFAIICILAYQVFK